MEKEELKEAMDKVYAIGFKNGQIAMKNKVLRKINHDWSLFTPQDLKIAMKIMKKINTIRLTAPSLLEANDK